VRQAGDGEHQQERVDEMPGERADVGFACGHSEGG
jgi:hypothetical protein